MLVLDSGGVSRLAERSSHALALWRALRAAEVGPAHVPTPVLVECLTGDGRRDARVNQLLRACEIVSHIPREVARRAAQLRTKARRGSAVDALVVALAEPDGTVLTADLGDLRALAAHAHGVRVERA